MDIGVIAKRYAKALLQFALEEGCEAQVYAEVNRFIAVYRQLPHLKEVLNNPLLRDAEKSRMLCEAAGCTAHSVFARFADLVVSRRRASLMLFIAHSYVSQYRSLKHISIGSLITATPVNDRVTQRLRDLVHRHTTDAAEVQIESKVDERLMGGFVFTIDDLRLDASVATQFERIKQQFIEQNKRIV
jgi:F-type H+-transporting ATPase subunit delta